MSIAAIVPAAGVGSRLGSGTPKALHELAGEPLLVHAVRALWSSAAVDAVVVAAPAGATASFQALLAASFGDIPLSVVDGGVTRQASVGRCLAALSSGTEVVVVHDAARPLAPVDLVDRVIEAVRDGAAAVVPVVPVADTVKRVADHVVVETVDRSHLRAVQTPQAFDRRVLERAHAAARLEATDDAALVEAIGVHVNVVDGSDLAFKVTRPHDLLVAEALLAGR